MTFCLSIVYIKRYHIPSSQMIWKIWFFVGTFIEDYQIESFYLLQYCNSIPWERHEFWYGHISPFIACILLPSFASERFGSCSVDGSGASYADGKRLSVWRAESCVAVQAPSNRNLWTKRAVSALLCPWRSRVAAWGSCAGTCWWKGRLACSIQQVNPPVSPWNSLLSSFALELPTCWTRGMVPLDNQQSREPWRRRPKNLPICHTCGTSAPLVPCTWECRAGRLWDRQYAPTWSLLKCRNRSNADIHCRQRPNSVV